MKRFVASVCMLTALNCSASQKPNIIFILADDMGFGDASCLNPEAKFQTPHLDSLAANGLTLSDAHSSSGVCTPSRYSVLTGRYCWRTWLKRGVFGGYNGALINDGRETIASALKAEGYKTACIGKWHVGMDFPTTDGKPAKQIGMKKGEEISTNIDWAGKIERSPISNGFDYFYGISASLDFPPYVYIENDRFTETPTTLKASHRWGPATADFEAVNVMGELTDKVIEFIDENASGNQPFFIYFPLTSPHNPRVPTKEWQNKSGIGSFGDFCMQTDHHVGEIMQALKERGIDENTLVVFSSDNGCENLAYDQFLKTGHSSSGQFRGVKRDTWEGGHRVPTFVHWPAKIKGGRISDETVCLTDFMPTFAAIAGHKLAANEAEDGVNLLPLLTGEKLEKPLREATIHHSLSGVFAIRQGDWVFIDAPTGSDRKNEPAAYAKARGYQPHNQAGELYDLSVDIEQKRNVYAEYPERVQQMKALLEKYKSQPRKTPVAK